MGRAVEEQNAHKWLANDRICAHQPLELRRCDAQRWYGMSAAMSDACAVDHACHRIGHAVDKRLCPCYRPWATLWRPHVMLQTTAGTTFDNCLQLLYAPTTHPTRLPSEVPKPPHMPSSVPSLEMPTITPSGSFSLQTFKPTPTPLHATSSFLSEMPTVRAPARAHNTPVPTSSQADLAFAAHIQPVWSAANVYCDHKRRLNKERWGIDPAQCKAKCIALKACRSYTSVVDAPGPLAEMHGGTDCLLWDDCLSLKRYQCDKCHAVTHMLPGPGSHGYPRTLNLHADLTPAPSTSTPSPFIKVPTVIPTSYPTLEGPSDSQVPWNLERPSLGL